MNLFFVKVQYLIITIIENHLIKLNYIKYRLKDNQKRLKSQWKCNLDTKKVYILCFLNIIILLLRCIKV